MCVIPRLWREPPGSRTFISSTNTSTNSQPSGHKLGAVRVLRLQHAKNLLRSNLKGCGELGRCSSAGLAVTPLLLTGGSSTFRDCLLVFADTCESIECKILDMTNMLLVRIQPISHQKILPGGFVELPPLVLAPLKEHGGALGHWRRQHRGSVSRMVRGISQVHFLPGTIDSTPFSPERGRLRGFGLGVGSKHHRVRP